MSLEESFPHTSSSNTSETSPRTSETYPTTTEDVPSPFHFDIEQMLSQPDEFNFSSLFRTSFDDDDVPKERMVRLQSIGGESGEEKSESTESEGEPNCHQYFDILSFAEQFVDNVILEAEGLINQHVSDIPIALRTIGPPSRDKVSSDQRFSDDFPLIMHARPQFTSWPTIREFTIEMGADKIDEYLSSFATDEEWMYIIYYLGVKKDEISQFYEYEAKWSLPSTEYPIAQATASVFFTIEVSDVIPLDCLVKVSFAFEGHQFRHTPGLIDFSEEWLNYILDAKMGVFKKIKF